MEQHLRNLIEYILLQPASVQDVLIKEAIANLNEIR